MKRACATGPEPSAPTRTPRSRWPPQGSPGLNLLVREDRGSTAMGLETLLTPIRLLNLEVLQCMAGVNRAMLDYGKCLLGGIGVAASQSLAKYWFQRAAQQGSKEARDLIPK